MKNASVLSRALVFGGVVTLGIAIVGSVVGYVVAGPHGLASALVGAGLTAVFMGVTTLSQIIATRVTRRDPGSPLFYGIVLGAWLLKFVLFIVILLLLRGQPWVSPYVFFFSMIAAVIGSLVADTIAMIGARVPYVDVELPEAPQD